MKKLKVLDLESGEESYLLADNHPGGMQFNSPSEFTSFLSGIESKRWGEMNAREREAYTSLHSSQELGRKLRSEGVSIDGLFPKPEVQPRRGLFRE